MMKTPEIKFNEKYYSIIPRPTQDEWHSLDQSIALNGLQEPVVINKKGVILDGYTRYEICQNRAIPIITRVKNFDTEEQELRYVLEVNATRRQLNAFQRVELFYEIFKVYKKQGKENNNWRMSKKNPVGGTLIRYSELVGVGQKRTHAAIKIIESDDETLKQKCRDGILTVNAAYNSMDEKIIPGNKNGTTHPYPPVKLMLKFFEDSPLKAELERIIDVYNKANSSVIPSQ